METKIPAFKSSKVEKKNIILEDKNKSLRNKLMIVCLILFLVLSILTIIAPKFRYFNSVVIPGVNDNVEVRR